MNQEKIGKFISEQRKKENLTQQQLAEKLNVSKNAVSKWERGLNLPDVSIMKDLCNILGITLNELFAGEKIKEEEYTEKTDESIVRAIEYTNKEIKKKSNKVLLIYIIIATIVISVSTMFVIDVIQMNQNKPVIFSTWGFTYMPAIDLAEEEIELAICDYLLEEANKETIRYETEKSFISMRIYQIDESDEQIEVYAWVLKQNYYPDEDEIKQSSGYSIPHRFVVEKKDGQYQVIRSQIPRDGIYYPIDMETLFPYSVRKDMEKVYYDGTSDRLHMDIQKQVKLYFHQ